MLLLHAARYLQTSGTSSCKKVRPTTASNFVHEIRQAEPLQLASRQSVQLGVDTGVATLCCLQTSGTLSAPKLRTLLHRVLGAVPARQGPLHCALSPAETP